MTRQSAAEQRKLNLQWEKYPQVAAFRAALTSHARAERLAFDARGMNAMFAFANDWLREHGPMPDSGIRTL